MRQNKNKKITKITSGALVLLLASGGLISNSLADGESLQAEGDSIKVSPEVTHSESIEGNLSDAVDNKTEDVEKNDNKVNKNINKVSFGENLAKVKSFTDENAGYNKEFKQRANKAYNDYSYLLNSDADESDIIKANDALLTIIQDESNNFASIEDTEEKVFDEEEIIEDDQSKEEANQNEEIEDEKNQGSKSEESEEEIVKDEKNEEPKEENQTPAKENDQENSKDKIEENKKNLPYSNKQEFIDFVGGYSDKAKAKNIFPSVMIGQAVHESGFGTSKLAIEDNNLFGIKAPKKKNSDSSSNSYKTEEYIDGKLVNTTDNFRTYDSFEESIDHYLNLLTNGSYAGNKVSEAKSAKEQLERIKKTEYATDPSYVEKVLNIIKSYNLTSFDKGFKEDLTNKEDNADLEKEDLTGKEDENKVEETEKPSTKPNVEDNLDENNNKTENDKKPEDNEDVLKDQDNKEDKKENPSNKKDSDKKDGSKLEDNNESEAINESEKQEKEENKVSEKELKQKLIDKINNVKILLKDGSWTKESGKEAESIIINAENALIKDELTEEIYGKIAKGLDNIQINVLKKESKSSKAYKPTFEKVVVDEDKSSKNDNKKDQAKKVVLKSAPNKENKSTNVKTGVKSLSSVLIALSSAGAAFFASRKRK